MLALIKYFRHTALWQEMIFLSVLLMLASSGRVQAQSEEQIRKFNEEREAYFNQKLDLSDAEKKAFWPVFNDFNKRKMRLMEEERNTFRYTRDNMENLSEKEMKETMDRILELKEGILALDKEYFGKKFPAILGDEKTMELYMAEWEFRRHLIGKLRGRDDRPGRGQGQGHGRGEGPPLDFPPPLPTD
jgi:hypothetical protein